jgi:R1.llaJI
MGKIVMPKNSAVLSEIEAALKIYYEVDTWIENDDYKRKLKAIIGDDQYESSYTKKAQIPSYFGFLEQEVKGDSRSRKRITDSGKRFYEAILRNAQDEIIELLIESLEAGNFGMNNDGAPSSDSPVEPPNLCIRAILDLGYLNNNEFAILLWQMADLNKSYEYSINRLRTGNLPPLPVEYNSYKDCKPIMIMERWGLLTSLDNPKGLIIHPDIMRRWGNRLAHLKVYNDFKEDIKRNHNKPHQRIFFGAPGTGKSYKLNQEANQYFGNNFKRVTFHPNYMYSNFVGQYKPYPVEDNPEKITYKFVPGVLIRQIVEAFENPDKNYLVIIEEINRANVAAVFGDLFQLLDRTSDGESEYSIAVTKELQDYLKNEFLENRSLSTEIENKLKNFSELYLPHNLYIWATMNSADQGVMPMDTAFKRRWEFTYLGVNDAADNNAAEFEKYVFEVNGVKYNWDMYRRGINDRLSRLNIPEDKLLGPYFLSKNILTNENKSYIADVLKNKVLMYLYEDAGRAFRGRLFREGSYNTYSQLCAEFDKDPLSIFKEPIEISESSAEEP